MVFIGVCYGKGLVTVIDGWGEVKVYLQEGIKSRSRLVKDELVREGILVDDWYMYDEIPLGCEVITEDESVTGKIHIKYNTKRERNRRV